MNVDFPWALTHDPLLLLVLAYLFGCGVAAVGALAWEPVRRRRRRRTLQGAAAA